MSRCTEIREICGDWAFNIVYDNGETFMLLFNSRRNAETVKKCLEVGSSIWYKTAPVDFVEVVRCKDCRFYSKAGHCGVLGFCEPNEFCSRGERKNESN